MSQHPELLEAFCRAIRPPSRQAPDQWAAQHVRLNSDIAEYYDPGATPALQQPFRRFFDNAMRELNVVAPPGIGKTTLFEAAICYIAAEDPGDVLVASKNEELLEQWLDARLNPILSRCEPIREYMPRSSDRQKKLLLLKHMFVAARAANEASLQQISVRWALGDECWMWNQGLIGYLRKRLHDRWNGRLILVSQAGYEGSEWHQACELGEQYRFHWRCACGAASEFRDAQLRWNGDEDKEAPIDWRRVRESVRLVCPACEKQYPDTAENRRQLVSAARWELVRPGEEPARETYVIPAMANFRVPWSRLAMEFLKARAALKLGDREPWFQYLTQRSSRFWRDDFQDDRKTELRTALYSWHAYAAGQKIEREAVRFLTIDRQSDHFWCLVRAFRDDGASRLVYYGKALTEEELRELQLRYQVEDRFVFQDASYDSDAVYKQCAKFGWFALHGTGETAFEHPKKDALGRVVGKEYRVYSRIREVAVGKVKARLIFLASERLKDITAYLRDGKSLGWEVPGDVGPEYRAQIFGEAKREMVNPKTKRSEYRWVRTSHQNHAFDVEYYATAAAIIAGVLSL